MIVYVAVVVFIISFRPSSIYIIIINSLSLFNSIADFNNTQCREFRSICGGRHYTPVAVCLLYCRQQPLRVSDDIVLQNISQNPDCWYNRTITV